MKKILSLILILFSVTGFSNEYGDWEKKYPEYKQIFQINKELYEDSQKLRDIHKSLISQTNKSKRDREKKEYLYEISSSFFNTHSLLNAYGQGLLFSYTSTLNIDKRSIHFHELCINLNYLLPTNTFSYRDSNSYKMSFIELGKELGINKSELNLISSGMDKQYELTKWMENICKSSLNQDFWKVK